MLFDENIKYEQKRIVFTDKHGQKLSSKKARMKIINRILNWCKDLELFIVHIVSLHIPIFTIRKYIFNLSGVVIGKGSKIHMGCKFFDPRGIRIGKDTIIGDGAFLDGRAPLIIGDHVDIASEVMIYNSEHDLESDTFSAREESVEVGDYVFIGPRTIILPGITIGKGAVVAAGAVVTRSVKEREIVAGVPAKVIGKRNLKLSYKLGRSRLFQ